MLKIEVLSALTKFGDQGRAGEHARVKRCPYMIYACHEFKRLSSERSFDSEGRPYPIIDDDLADVLSRSDFAKSSGRSRGR